MGDLLYYVSDNLPPGPYSFLSRHVDFVLKRDRDYANYEKEN